jgi:hypothetical protein
VFPQGSIVELGDEPGDPDWNRNAVGAVQLQDRDHLVTEMPTNR